MILLLLIQGLELEKQWRKTIWMIITKVTTIAIQKCNTKIRFKITHAALHIHTAIIIPQQCKTDNIFIITIIPQ